MLDCGPGFVQGARPQEVSLRYVGNVIRPPSEADSLILQVTYGCSHNRCRFCGAYPQAFGVKPLPEVEADLDWVVRRHGDDVRRLFLADGNALVRSDGDLLAILAGARSRFPRLRRVASYANARDLLRRDVAGLRRLADAGLRLVYVGLESGDDEVLARMDKGATAAQTVQAVLRAQEAGMTVSVMALLGLAGDDPSLSARHARATAAALTAMQPRFVNFLTVMIVPGTPLADDEETGRFRLPDERALLGELRTAVESLELRGSIFRANHASNPLPLEGNLPRDTERLLDIIDAAREGRVGLVPEFLRGL